MAKIGPFRFWCQKVLPLVYDESMSYYELLNKVVLYLNNVISDFDTVAENFDNLDAAFDSLQAEYNTTKNALLQAYEQLQTYVNDYFDNLDVQEEINNKLDAMAESGELQTLLAPFIASQISDDVAGWLADHITPTTPAVDDTLTVKGAAADALAAGIRFKTVTEPTENLFIPNFLSQTVSGTATMTNTGTEIIFDGTTAAGTGSSCIISLPFYLSAGSYRFGFMTNVSSSKMNIKLRVYDNGSAGTDLSDGGTSSSKAVTISTAGMHCIQLRYFGGQDLTGISAQIYVIPGETAMTAYVPGLTARDFTARNAWKTGPVIPTGTDLDTLLTPGVYRGSNSNSYINGPLVGGVFTPAGSTSDSPMTGYNFIMSVIGQTSSKVTIQRLEIVNIGEGKPYAIYYRVATGAGPTFSQDWRIGYEKSTLDLIYFENFLDDNSSLNDAPVGYTRGGSSKHFMKCPPELVNTKISITDDGGTTTTYDAFTGYDFILLTLGQKSSAVKLQYLYLCNMGSGTPYAVFFRIATGTAPTWQEWRPCLVDNLDDTNTATFVPEQDTGNVAYTGTPVRLMTYNVEHWNHDKSSYITNAKIKAIRRFLCREKPDFVCVQESGYINADQNKSATDYIFRPLYPKDYGRGEVRIHSKRAANAADENGPVTYGCVSLTYTRRLSYMRTTINSKDVLIASVHTIAAPDHQTSSDDPASIAAREAQFDDIFAWLNHEIALTAITGAADPPDVYAPAYDACIIGGDFNTITDTDKTNLATYAGAVGFQLTNGTYLGWLESQHNTNGVKALDNVCYKGCVCEGMRMHKGAAQRFWSDHYPFIVDFIIPD